MKRILPDISDENFKRLQEIGICWKHKTYRRRDEDTGRYYCTYFGVTNQIQSIDCKFRLDEIIYVEKGWRGFTHDLPYYRCSNR